MIHVVEANYTPFSPVRTYSAAVILNGRRYVATPMRTTKALAWADMPRTEKIAITADKYSK